MTDHGFCSRISQAQEGVFPGTGVRGEIYVFLPVNKRLWGSSEFNAAWATLEELNAIRQARRAGVTARLYNPKEDSAPILVYASPSASAATRIAVESLTDSFSGRGWKTDMRGAPRLAICTQGTRDRCCAKWGFAVYRQTSKFFLEGSFAFEPLECSHLGGDRYAATAIFFPSGSMYAHLDRADILAIGNAEAAGQITGGNYRGRVFEDELIQIVRAGLARDGHAVGTTSPLKILNPEATTGTVIVAAGQATFRVTLATMKSDFYGSCKALGQGRLSHADRIVYSGGELVSGSDYRL